MARRLPSRPASSGGDAACTNSAINWDVDTARAYETVNGVEARGGSLDGPGPVVADGILPKFTGAQDRKRMSPQWNTVKKEKEQRG